MGHPDGYAPFFPTSRPPLRYTPETAKVLAAQVRDLINQPRHEWYVALWLDTDGVVLDWSVLYDGRQHANACPCLPHVDVPRFMDQAHTCATEAVLVRYHPHPWVGPVTGAAKRFQTIVDLFEASEVGLADHLSLDTHGATHQFRAYGVGSFGHDGDCPRRRRGLGIPIGTVCGIISEISLAIL